MPKVYDQQISWQPTGTQKMQYDRLQDFITPALENANRASQNAMEMMQQIGDKQAASDLEQAARDSAIEIENWQDFSEPEKTQDKMVASAMEKYDAVIANMDYATRNRMNMYNPKAREIYELKAKEKAADVSYNYAYRTALANQDADVGRMISEAAPEGPEAVKARVDQHLAKAKSSMRPLDYNMYEKSTQANAQKGLIDWYVAYGDIDKALATVKNDRYAGAINESIRANYLKALTKAKADKASGGADDDNVGTNLVDTLVRSGQTPQYAYTVMTSLTSAIQSRYEPDKQLIEQFGSLPLAGGYNYYQLANMDYTKAVGIIDKSMKAVGKSETITSEARAQFVPLMTEWARITDDHGNLNTDGDITTLKGLYKDFVENGYDQQLRTSQNSDLYNTFNKIADAVNKEKASQSLAFSLNGQNMSAVTNNPVLQSMFDTPGTPEEAKTWNDPQRQQFILNKKEAMNQMAGMNAIYNSAFEDWANTGATAGKTSKYNVMREDLKRMRDKGELTETQYKARLRHLYDISEGKTDVVFPCLDANTPTSVWNQCLVDYGFDTVDDSAKYDKKLDKGMHTMSAVLRNSSRRKYESGTVGDVYQVLLSQINLAVHTKGLAEKYGIQNPGVFTGDFLADVMTDLETGARQGELDNIVDLTNNSSIYKEKGGDYEGISWNPANPSPETTLDITKSKQYQLIEDIEEAISLRIGNENAFRLPEEQKRSMAMNIRRISSGKKHSVTSDVSNSDVEELRNKRANVITKQLIGK